MAACCLINPIAPPQSDQSSASTRNPRGSDTALRLRFVLCYAVLFFGRVAIGEDRVGDEVPTDCIELGVEADEPPSDLVDGDDVISHHPMARLIDLTDRRQIDRRRPIIVAHRGGVITESSPECSLTAIRLAAEQGYDMVELDVQVSRDGVPIVFHDRTLNEACGRDGQVADFTAAELESIAYLASSDQIARLDTALEACRHRKVGVMLDFKSGRDSVELVRRVNSLLDKHDFGASVVTISDSLALREGLTSARFTPTQQEMDRLRAGAKIDLSHRFWFGLPSRLKSGDLGLLKSAGVLVIPAINTFRYPADQHEELARRDIERLTQAGVDGFQIDSVYFSLLRTSAKNLTP